MFEFRWRASCNRVIDGDTLDLTLDKGFRETAGVRVRLAGINCPETHGATKAAGDAARTFALDWIGWIVATPVTWPLVITTYKTDSFDRYVAVVHRADDPVSLNDALLASGNAVPFMIDKVP